MARRVSGSTEAPLFAWGDALRAARRRRRRTVRRGAALALGAGLLGATIAVPPAPRLVWNASASAPLGLYAVAPHARPAIGDMVVARLPRRFRLLAARRHYLPRNVPLVKRVAAVAGDAVCARGAAVFVNGTRVAIRQRADRLGRPLPWWEGCVRLQRDQFFLLLAASPASFDGRYFGMTATADVVGRARLLWPR